MCSPFVGFLPFLSDKSGLPGYYNLDMLSKLRQRADTLMLPSREGLSLSDRRPLLMPACAMYISCLISYFASDMQASLPLFVAALSITAGLIASTFIFIRYKLLSHILVYCSIACISVFLGLYINMTLNKTLDTDPVGLTVTRIDRRLDGSLRIECETDNGFRVMVIPKTADDIGEGDIIRVSDELQEPSSGSNPGGFDYRSYLRRKGINRVMFCDRAELITDNKGLIYSFLEFIYRIRLRILDKLSLYDPGKRMLIAAICLGDTSLLDEETSYNFKMCDCSHLLAVSGMHFAGFLFVLPYLIKALKLRKSLAVPVYILFAVAIGLITGFSESVTRASIMSCCSFAGRDRVSAICLAVMVMLMADPFAALSSGFTMSFASCIAIVFLGDRVNKGLEKLYIPKSIRDVISPALCASMGLMPLWDMTSYRLSPVLFLLQVLAGVICEFCCIFFIPSLITGITAPLTFMLDLLAGLMEKGRVISVFASVPPAVTGGIGALALPAVAVLLVPDCFARRVLIKPLSILLCITIGFEIVSFCNRPKATVVFADVGQGDCCLVITPDKTCLIDAGIYEEGDKTVRDILDYYGIARVDYAFMSHWDTDHAAGIVALMRQNRIGSIYTAYTDIDEDVSDFLAALDLDPSFVACVNKASAGTSFELSSEVRIDILYPLEASGGGNEQSLVMTLNAGDLKVLFTGDIGLSTEEELLDLGIVPDTDILKVAHHGSRYSTSAAFLEASSPDIAVISVGADNFYGHPSDETLARLEEQGISILRTDTQGAVIIEAR